MSAPVAAYVTLETDGSGKKIRTYSRSISGQTVHQQVMVKQSPREIKGIYNFTTALYTVAASAQNGTSAAIGWLVNPASSLVNVRLRYLKITIANAVATAIDHATAPRIAVQRALFVGTGSGASLTPAKRKTTDQSASGVLYTASTGMTVTLQGILWAALVAGGDFTTAGIYKYSASQEWRPESDDEYIEIRPGEALAIYQIDAGTTSDQRRALVTGCWDEVDQ